jgi:hypothetical protein
MRGILLMLLTLLPAAAQDFTVATLSRHILTNEGVITLAKAGFDELFIIQRIHTSRTRFDTTVEGLVALKQAGVSEDLIEVMAVHDIRNHPFPVEGPPAALSSAPASQSAAPAASVEGTRVLVDKHWWGFHWVRITR